MRGMSEALGRAIEEMVKKSGATDQFNTILLQVKGRFDQLDERLIAILEKQDRVLAAQEAIANRFSEMEARNERNTV